MVFYNTISEGIAVSIVLDQQIHMKIVFRNSATGPQILLQWTEENFYAYKTIVLEIVYDTVYIVFHLLSAWKNQWLSKQLETLAFFLRKIHVVFS